MGNRGPKRDPNSRRGRAEARRAALAAMCGTAPVLPEPSAVVDAKAPPAHLSPAMRDFWRRVVAEHELKSHQVAVLKTGCEAWDRAEQARLLIARDGLIAAGRRHPAIDIEAQSQGLFSACDAPAWIRR